MPRASIKFRVSLIPRRDVVHSARQNRLCQSRRWTDELATSCPELLRLDCQSSAIRGARPRKLKSEIARSRRLEMDTGGPQNNELQGEKQLRRDRRHRRRRATERGLRRGVVVLMGGVAHLAMLLISWRCSSGERSELQSSNLRREIIIPAEGDLVG